MLPIMLIISYLCVLSASLPDLMAKKLEGPSDLVLIHIVSNYADADAWAKNQLGVRRLGESYFGRQAIGRQQSFQKRRFGERRLDDIGLRSLRFYRSDVFSSQFSDGLTLSWHKLKAVVLYIYGQANLNFCVGLRLCTIILF